MWELQIEIQAEDQPEAEAWAWGLGVGGLCIEDAETGRSDGRTVLRVWLAADADREAVTSELAELLPGAVLRWLAAPDPEASAPRLVGARFAVVGIDQDAPTGRIPLRVRSGLAFGDGHHPSSALCLGAMEELALAGPLPACLDVGTGTGLLCLAAGALGSPRLGAVDIDSLALQAASEAFDRAGLQVELSTEIPDQPWPLILANLHRAAILAVVDPLSQVVAPGGRLLVSGFVQAAEEEISRQLGLRGLVVRRRWRDQGWVALLMGRPAVGGPAMEM
jgi:ribosomal protein L11 methylase PrmA